MSHLDLILLDTAGRSPKDEVRIQELKMFLTEAGADEVHLVLSSVAAARTLEQTAERFAAVGTTALILTKLDEASGLGNVLPVLRSSGLPLSYLTNGQNVPDDIETADARRLARMILQVDLGHDVGIAVIARPSAFAYPFVSPDSLISRIPSCSIKPTTCDDWRRQRPAARPAARPAGAVGRRRRQGRRGHDHRGAAAGRALTHAGKRTLLVDADPRGGDAAMLCGVEERHYVGRRAGRPAALGPRRSRRGPEGIRLDRRRSAGRTTSGHGLASRRRAT